MTKANVVSVFVTRLLLLAVSALAATFAVIAYTNSQWSFSTLINNTYLSPRRICLDDRADALVFSVTLPDSYEGESNCHSLNRDETIYSLVSYINRTGQGGALSASTIGRAVKAAQYTLLAGVIGTFLSLLATILFTFGSFSSNRCCARVTRTCLVSTLPFFSGILLAVVTYLFLYVHNSAISQIRIIAPGESAFITPSELSSAVATDHLQDKVTCYCSTAWRRMESVANCNDSLCSVLSAVWIHHLSLSFACHQHQQ